MQFEEGEAGKQNRSFCLQVKVQWSTYLASYKKGSMGVSFENKWLYKNITFMGTEQKSLSSNRVHFKRWKCGLG